MDSLDQLIAEHTDEAIAALARLISEPSTVGSETGAQEVMVDLLASAGFDVVRLPIPEDIAFAPGAGVPFESYTGRYDVIGRRGHSEGALTTQRSLVINGHIDVVPAEDAERWISPPFEPTVRNGWMHGRGAGDMKSGFASGLLAIRALDAARPGWLGEGALTIVSAIEEEYTGNGTLAACRAGYLGDAALLLEPTDLDVLLAGIGIIWVEIVVGGHSGHAESAARISNPIRSALPILRALEDFERTLNEEHRSGLDADPAFAKVSHPYNVNIGSFHAGDWASSVPDVARISVRAGYPRRWDASAAFDAITEVVMAASAGDEWLREHPPTLRLSGFRAERYAQAPSGELIETLRAAHAEVHGAEPDGVAMGSTTDARFYLNQYGVPAVAYGTRTRNMHGIDEAVELASIVDVARTVARFLLAWFRPQGDEHDE